MLDSEEKLAFSVRLNEVLDDEGFPASGKNRQALLGKRFGVTQTAARKWLVGDGLPTMAKSILIAKEFGVGIEWLLTGRGLRAAGPEAFITAQESNHQSYRQPTESEQRIRELAYLCRPLASSQLDALIKLVSSFTQTDIEAPSPPVNNRLDRKTG